MTTVTIQEWMDAAIESSKELATTMLGMEDAKFVADKSGLFSQNEAAYIALVGESTALQLGIGASPENCMLLAKSLLGMTPEEPDMEPEEVADAISEIVNILGGQIKQRMSGATSVNLGLPIFMKGEMFAKSGTQIRISEMDWDGIVVLVLVLKND